MVWKCSTNGRGETAKKVMKWSRPGRRKRGRPKITWTEGIRGLMEEKGLWKETGMTETNGGRR